LGLVPRKKTFGEIGTDFFRAGCSSHHPGNSVNALKSTAAGKYVTPSITEQLPSSCSNLEFAMPVPSLVMAEPLRTCCYQIP